MSLPTGTSSQATSETERRRTWRGPVAQVARRALRRCRRWLEPLFPEASPYRARRPLVLGVYAVALAVAVGVLLARQTGVPATNSIWAEDGSLFYTDSVTGPFLHTIFSIYNGYIHLYPRLLFGVIGRAPVNDVAAWIAIGGAATVGAVALLVFHASRGHVRSPLLRAVLAAAVVLFPLAPPEVLNNLVNAQWWLMFAAFWVLLWRPRSWSGRIIGGVVCLLATGSDPLAGVLIPVALARLVALERSGEHLITAGYFGGLALQLGARLAIPQPSFYHGPPVTILKQFGIRVGAGLLGGRRITDALVAPHQNTIAAVGFALFVVIVVFAWLFGERRIRLFVELGGLVCLLAFVVPTYLRWTVLSPVQSTNVIQNSRYSLVSILVLLSLIVVSLDNSRGGPVARYALTGLLVCALIPSWILDYRYKNLRTAGPSWSSQVAAASSSCRLHGRGTASLVVSPAPYFVVRVPCRIVNNGSDAGGVARPVDSGGHA
jgi:hypothetical protein